MKILPISYLNNTLTNIHPKRQSMFTFNNGLYQDTVEFTGKNTNTYSDKFAEEEDDAIPIPYRDGMAIYRESEIAKADFVNMLKHELKPLVETKTSPDRPIAAGKVGIHGRVKAPYSLVKKATSRDKIKKDEIKNLGDVIAARIVLRDSSQQSFDDVFNVLGNLVKKGKLNVTEVENYRPTPKESYVSQKTLDKFEETCLKAGLRPSVISEAKPSGYTAVQLNIRLKNGQVAELQIMGRDVEAFKDIDDLFYKRYRKDPKPLPDKYKLIEKILDEKIKGLTDFQRETLDNYRKDGYKYARELPPTVTQENYDTDNFLPLPYSLPQELSFAYLYRMKETADYIEKLK